jgi:hypothetical protein
MQNHLFRWLALDIKSSKVILSQVECPVVRDALPATTLILIYPDVIQQLYVPFIRKISASRSYASPPVYSSTFTSDIPRPMPMPKSSARSHGILLRRPKWRFLGMLRHGEPVQP